MSLQVKQTSHKSTGDGPELLIDGDIIIRACASAADGRGYRVVGCQDSFKYIKDAKSYCRANKLPYDTIELTYDPDPLPWALHSVDEMILSIINELQSDNYQIFLTEGSNFRYDIYTEYKANRKDYRLPAHLPDCKKHIKEKWDARSIKGIEADDAIRIEAVNNPASVVCSIDKDFDIIQGWHYNWNTNKMYFVTGSEALRNFYTQMITGDTADNIIALSEKKPKKRTYKVEPLQDMQFQDEMEWYVYCGYVLKYGEEEALKQMNLNGRLLWLLTGMDDIWEAHI